MKPNTPSSARYSILNDETLISLVLAGQEHAYTILVKRYECTMHSVLRSYLPDYEARQEVVQDTFIRAYRALSRFRGDCNFSTWLSKIARSQALSRLRMRRYETWDSIEANLTLWEADFYTSEVILEKQESNQLLRLAVEQLSPTDALAIKLFYFCELSLTEIGALTGWTTNNIKARLFRARQRLQLQLLKEGFQAAC